jgi:hypothetical protein
MPIILMVIDTILLLSLPMKPQDITIERNVMRHRDERRYPSQTEKCSLFYITFNPTHDNNRFL